ncbi:thioesterase family protein [Thermofilum pendens]|uniref:Thioesterase superfamily n=1 Tax=Thermofilum pendens (strain DSM 2475 / Hrk 5) TaxID=368408 RepID=A1S0D7_THEPD|nr:Thioesterase superfamily [Thermofilum pendens Hrk 5]
MVVEGEAFSRTYTVQREHLARHISLGDTGILSTPNLVAFMEEASRVFLDEKLGKDYTTVGVRIDVHHVAPALLGSQVEVRGRILRSDGRRVTLWIEAWSGKTLIGYAVHERAVVKREEYLERIRSMLSSRAGG